MTVTRLNPVQNDLLKCVGYSSALSNYGGGVSFTHTVPSGYKLLCGKPLGAYTSGDASSYVTDRGCSQSGSTVTVSFYVHNPYGANVMVCYDLLYVKS